MTFSLDSIGYVAALCSASGYIPQVIKVWKSRSCNDISMRTFVVLVTGFCLWMAYGIHKGDWPLILTNCVTITCGSIILYFKLTAPKCENEPEGMREVEVTTAKDRT